MKTANTQPALHQSISRVVVVTALLLLIPLIAMQFTREVNWTVGDFVAAGILLGGTGLIYERIVKRLTTAKHRIIAGAILFIMLFLVWAELAVGIFGE